GSLAAGAPCLSWREPEGFTSQRPMDVILAPQYVRGPDEPGLDRSALDRTRVGLHPFRFAPSLCVVSVGTRFARVSDLLPAAGGLADRALEEIDLLAASRLVAIAAIPGVAEHFFLLAD